MTAAEMHKNAILVTLSISTWSARKYDKQVTREVNRAHAADADAGRYNKKLLPGDAPEYKALMQHVNEMRTFHYLNTLPWNDDGARILTIKNYKRYTDRLRKGTNEFYSLLDDFERAYPRLRADARIKLNGMFNDSDYPEDIRSKFAFAYRPDPMPTTGDLRVSLPAEEMKILEKQVEERTKQRLEEAQGDAIRKLFKVVAAIQERLSGTRVTKDRVIKDRKTKKDKYDSQGNLIPAGTVIPGKVIPGGEVKDATFQDSLIENAREMCDVLKRINLGDDPKLEQFRRQTELMAGSTEPETLRNDAEVRTETAARAKDILDAMTATYGNMFN